MATGRKARLDEVVSTGKPVRFEDERAGIVFDHTLYPVFGEAGNVASIVAFSQDVTGRKRAEEEIKRLSEERKTLIDNLPAMIWHKDTHNNFLGINPAAARTFGVTEDEIAGRSTYRLFPEMAEKYYQDDLEVIRSGVPKFGIVEQMKTARGEKIWVRTDKIPLRNKQGTITGLIVLCVDITEMKLADIELFTKSERLNAANLALIADRQGTAAERREAYRIPRRKRSAPCRGPPPGQEQPDGVYIPHCTGRGF